jgi:hypothetical protein
MDLARLRFGDWVMGLGGLALALVMFLDWYELPEDVVFISGGVQFSAWESFAVNDVILALAALMALTAVFLTATQPTAAVPLALASLTTLVAVIALVLVTVRVIWTPDVEGLDTDRTTGVWLGLVATSVLVAGCLASIRDERMPRPEQPVEPRLVRP